MKRVQAMRNSLLAFGAMLLLAAGWAHADTVTYIYTDPQGTPLAEADIHGNITATYDYAPYGSQAMGAAHDGPGYTGHVNDADTGLVYMQARYYDPVVGRFISTDPVGPGPGNPYNFNRYAYANNNPIVNMDADGRMTGSLTNPNGVGVAGAGYVMFVNPSESEGGASVHGKAQKSSKTPTHASTSQRIADEAAKDPDVKSVHMNQSLRTVTGDKTAPNVQPDVTIVKNNGSIDQVEVRSAGQSVAELRGKMAGARIGLGVPGNDILVEPDPAMGALRSLGTIGVIEMVFHQYVNHYVEEKKEAKMSADDREMYEFCKSNPGCT